VLSSFSLAKISIKPIEQQVWIFKSNIIFI
jgi:hypothetical protein